MARRKKQTEIPGAEAPSIAAIDDAIAPYVETLDQRIELQQREPELKAQVVERMRDAGLDAYKYQDGEAQYVFTRNETETLKVKRQAVSEE